MANIAQIAEDLRNADTSHNRAQVATIYIGALDKEWWQALCDMAGTHNVKVTALAKAILREAVTQRGA